MSHITIENQVLIEQILPLFMQGMDFADALHLVQAEHCEQFVTFDKKFANKAKRLCTSQSVIVPDTK